MVEIVARKTRGSKNSHKSRSNSESTETSCATEDLLQPKRVLDHPVIDVNGYDLNLDSLIRLGTTESDYYNSKLLSYSLIKVDQYFMNKNIENGFRSKPSLTMREAG